MSDVPVLSAVERMSRKHFLPADLIDQAYDEVMLPLGDGAYVPSATLVGVLGQHLQLERSHKILEIGTGSGYQSAVLAQVCSRVFTIERRRDLHSFADRAFQALHITNIVNVLGDGSKGWPQEAKFDRIIVNAATNQIDDRVFSQLKEGGFVLAPLGLTVPGQHLYKLQMEDGQTVSEQLMESQYPPLVEDHSKA